MSDYESRFYDCRSEVETLTSEIESLRQQLAQRDARIGELREALGEIANTEYRAIILPNPNMEVNPEYNFVTNNLHQLAFKALSTTDDLSSLNRVRAEALREAADFDWEEITYAADTIKNELRCMADELEGKAQ
jgi:hypothetical protein